MAISTAVRTPIEWRSAVKPARAPLATIIPAIDAIALAGAAIAAGHSDRLGMAYTFVAFVVLMATGTHHSRINPQLGGDAAPLVGWLCLPLLAVAPLARSD